ncbi:MAG: SAM-dependent chlorinase/fluorinase [Spirochaetaceae bacterium]|nr:SAM-dependent chlorinase/fluorinase [Spirochaetaceae bacterium]
MKMMKLVFQSDFGLSDAGVSAMKGIAYGVVENLIISDITHDISPFNIREASYRLFQVVDFWPEETVFVSVVDPGVGSERKSVVAKLNGDRFIVTPDNGTLTHLFHSHHILETREIDETVNRLEGSGGSHTFHGRDVYAYTGARLAGRIIQYSEVGKRLDLNDITRFDRVEVQHNGNSLSGIVEILDVRFGHIWTNITEEDMKSLELSYGDILTVELMYKDRELFRGVIPFCKTFYDVNPGDKLVYINSMMNVALGIHQESFADLYGIKAGPEYKIRITGA